MRRFSELCEALVLSRRPDDQTELLIEYFNGATPADAAWAVYLLKERRVSRQVTAQRLKQAAISATGLTEWLVESCIESVGDVSEVIALLVPQGGENLGKSLSDTVEQTVQSVGKRPAEEQIRLLRQIWETSDVSSRRVIHRLLLGCKLVTVRESILARALAARSGLSETILLFRLARFEHPTVDNFTALVAARSISDEVAQPYPFLPYKPVQHGDYACGEIGDWRFDWEWHGVRAQLIVRHEQVLLWSEFGNVLNCQFPEMVQCASRWPHGTVVEGFVVILEGGRPSGGGNLSKRMTSREPSRQMRERFPAQFLIVDLLEIDAQDQRSRSSDVRRTALDEWFSSQCRRTGANSTATLQGDLFTAGCDPTVPSDGMSIALAPRIEVGSWEALEACRQGAREMPAQAIWMRPADGSGAEASDVTPGRRLLPDPLYADAVLIAAELGDGKRGELFARYSFAVLDESDLVPIGKSSRGLTLREIRTIDEFVRQNTVARHGPVRSVTATLVFRLRFSSVTKSNRHRSGLILRDLEMAEFWSDRELQQISSLADLHRLLPHSLTDS